MKNVIIVSKCLGITKFNDFENWYHFHFRGVFAGQDLRKLLLKGKVELGIKKEDEYLLYCDVTLCDSGVLKGTIIKAKNLEICWDKS